MMDNVSNNALLVTEQNDDYLRKSLVRCINELNLASDCLEELLRLTFMRRQLAI